MSKQPAKVAVANQETSLAGVPELGWRVQLDYYCKEIFTQFGRPSLYQVYKLPTLLFYGIGAYIVHFYRRWKGKRPIAEFPPLKPIYGSPIGGIGAGTIGRGYRGEFCHFQMVPGMYERDIIQADAFILTVRKKGETVYQTVLTGSRTSNALDRWQWVFPLHQATYHALYPRAWTVYDIPEYSLRLTCRQVSPIIPNDYKDSSFPMAIFVWTVENKGIDNLDISITFTFQSGVRDRSQQPCSTEPFIVDQEYGTMQGMLIHQSFNDMPCTYAVAARETVTEQSKMRASLCKYFDPIGSGCEIWDTLHRTGKLNEQEGGKQTWKGGAGVGVSLEIQSRSKSKTDAEFALVWDMPKITFGAGNKQYTRRYNRWFNKPGGSATEMASYCILNYRRWEEAIEKWQQPVLKSRRLPVWYKALLFNELYFISDGGTVWLDPVDEDSADKNRNPLMKEYGKFAYLEGHNYRLYNTLDVHFYASFALIMLWPKLQLSMQYDIANSIFSEDKEYRVNLYSGSVHHRNVLYSTPHDMGGPIGEPWCKVNDHDGLTAVGMKDIGSKFVLQVYRDYHETGDLDFLRDMYPAMKAVLDRNLSETGEDGLPNSGQYCPDQTFSGWAIVGTSAYCGGLWIAALRVVVEAASILRRHENKARYSKLLAAAAKAFNDKLWNGRYYNCDCSRDGACLMSMQLVGHWYLKASGITDDSIFSSERVRSVLHEIFKRNVQGPWGESLGAVNATRPDGTPHSAYIHSEQFFTGVTYSVAAQMIQENMLEEALQTAWGSYSVCWERFGFHFQSPEAVSLDRKFRHPGYMRVLAVWAMQHALLKYRPDLFD